jgi:hypothetical protein
MWYFEGILTEYGETLRGYVNAKGKIVVKLNDNQHLVCTGVNDMMIIYGGIMGGSNYGLLDKDGVEILKPEYDYISFREYDGVSYGDVATSGDAKGVLDSHGKWILKPEFHKIDRKNHYAFFQKEKDGKWGFYDLKNRKILIDSVLDGRIDSYAKESGYSDALRTVWQGVRENKKWGFVSFATGRVITPIFDKIERLSADGLAAVSENGKWGFVNEDAQLAINPRFEKVLPFKNGLAGVKFEGKWGYINKKDKWIIPPIFSDADNFSNEGLARAETIVDGHRKWGYIDKKGEWVIPPAFSAIGVFDNEGLAPAADIGNGNRHAYGVINRAGEWVFRPNTDFEKIGSFAPNGLAVASFLGEGWIHGYINKKGEWVIRPNYRYASDFNDCSIAEMGDTPGSSASDPYEYRDGKNRTVSMPRYSVYESLTRYCRGSRTFLTADGSVHPKIMALLKNDYIIGLHYSRFNQKVEFIGVWSDGRISAQGLIDSEGNVLIKPIPEAFFENYPFYDSNFSRIYLRRDFEAKLGVVNTKGEFIFAFGDYDIDRNFCTKGLAWIRRVKDGKFGVINREYKFVVAPQYDAIDHVMMCGNNLFRATKKDEKSGFERQYWLDESGTVRFHTDMAENKYVLKNSGGEILWQAK